MRKTTKLWLLSTCLMLLLSKNSIFASQQTIYYEKMGIRQSSLENEAVVPPKILEPQIATLTEPGRSKKLIKPYFTAPPQIPHSVKEYLPITQKSNMCLSCHKPQSHFFHPRTGQKLNSIYYGMYNCSMCHTPQLDVEPPVKNIFNKWGKKQ